MRGSDTNLELIDSYLFNIFIGSDVIFVNFEFSRGRYLFIKLYFILYRCTFIEEVCYIFCNERLYKTI